MEAAPDAFGRYVLLLMMFCAHILVSKKISALCQMCMRPGTHAGERKATLYVGSNQQARDLEMSGAKLMKSFLAFQVKTCIICLRCEVQLRSGATHSL